MYLKITGITREKSLPWGNWTNQSIISQFSWYLRWFLCHLRACHWRKWFLVFRESLKQNTSSLLHVKSAKLVLKWLTYTTSSSLPTTLCGRSNYYPNFWKQQKERERKENVLGQQLSWKTWSHTREMVTFIQLQNEQDPNQVISTSFSKTEEQKCELRAQATHGPMSCTLACRHYSGNWRQDPWAHPATAKDALWGVAAASTLKPPSQSRQRCHCSGVCLQALDAMA